MKNIFISFLLASIILTSTKVKSEILEEEKAMTKERMKELLERILIDPQYLALDVNVQLRILIAISKILESHQKKFVHESSSETNVFF
jgi:hypothetical protein